jgi:hypothetical protein
VTFYPWCTGCRIPVHACLFTGSLSVGCGLSGARRCRESDCENENKDRQKAFHGASRASWGHIANDASQGWQPPDHAPPKRALGVLIFRERGRARSRHGSLYRQRLGPAASDKDMGIDLGNYKRRALNCHHRPRKLQEFSGLEPESPLWVINGASASVMDWVRKVPGADKGVCPVLLLAWPHPIYRLALFFYEC